MYNIIKADLYKLHKSTAIKVLFGFTTICAVITVIMAYMIPKGKINASMSGIGFMFSDANMMSLIGAAIAGIFICGDFDNRLIHDTVANGYNRTTIIISKTVVFILTIALMLLPYAAVTVIALSSGCKFSMGSASSGFLYIMTSLTSKAVTFSASNVFKLIAVMLVTMFVYIGQLSICIPLAVSFKKPVLVVVVYYTIVILCARFIALKGLSKTFDNIFACTPFGGTHPFLTLSTSTGDILKTISVSVIFLIVMLTISCFAFKKSEIK